MVSSYFFKREDTRMKLDIVSLPISFCNWEKGTLKLIVSNSFLNMFFKDVSDDLTSEELIMRFDDSFRKSVKQLMTIGGSVSFRMQDLDKTYQVEGVESSNNFTFSFFDVTQLCEEVDFCTKYYDEAKEEYSDFKMLLEFCPIAAYKRNINGKIDYVNPEYEKLVNNNLPNIVNNNIEIIKDTYHKAKQSNGFYKKETQFVINGNRNFIEVIEYIDKDKGYGYATNCTKEHYLTKELQQKDNTNLGILQNISSPIAIFDSSKRLIVFNKAYVKLFNYDENWLNSKPTLGEILNFLNEKQFLPEDEDFPTYKRKRNDLFNNLITSFHEIIHQPDGKTLSVVITPYGDGGLLYVFENITYQLMLERKYNTLISVQRTTLDHLHEGVIVWGDDHKVRLVNAAFSTIINSKDSIEIGQNIADCMQVIPKQKMLKMMFDRLPLKEEIVISDEKIIEFRYIPLPDGSHLLSLVDISSRFMVQKALSEKNKALETVNMLKNNLISHISYELKSPLNTIAGLSEVMLKEYFGNLNERQKDYFKNIHESSIRLIDLVSDMLQLAKIEDGTLKLTYQKTNMLDLLKEVVELIFSQTTDLGIEVILKPSEPITIECDQIHLKHAILNLLENSLKFTPKGGKVFLEIKNLNDKELLISVLDTGVGIENADQERIFDLFEKSKKQIPGMGLGLPLVKKIVELHGGNVFLESQKDIGTAFYIKLPMYQ